ncbi:MAG: hypothetical protein ACI4QE_03525, partial [Acutalibacteraceae bacterium]
IKRITDRDKISKEEAKVRIKAQHSNNYYREKSDFYIENNDDIVTFEKKLNDICEVLDGCKQKG